MKYHRSLNLFFCRENGGSGRGRMGTADSQLVFIKVNKIFRRLLEGGDRNEGGSQIWSREYSVPSHHATAGGLSVWAAHAGGRMPLVLRIEFCRGGG